MTNKQDPTATEYDAEIEDVVRAAIQEEFTGEIWYESNTINEQSQRLFNNLQMRLVKDITTLRDKAEARGREAGANEERTKLVEQIHVAILASRDGMQGRANLYGGIKHMPEWMMKNISYTVERIDGMEDVARWIEKGYLPGASLPTKPITTTD